MRNLSTILLMLALLAIAPLAHAAVPISGLNARLGDFPRGFVLLADATYGPGSRAPVEGIPVDLTNRLGLVHMNVRYYAEGDTDELQIVVTCVQEYRSPGAAHRAFEVAVPLYLQGQMARRIALHPGNLGDERGSLAGTEWWQGRLLRISHVLVRRGHYLLIVDVATTPEGAFSAELAVRLATLMDGRIASAQ
jgi:hypothetical protein